MRIPFRAIASAPLSRFRSFEERLGIIGFSLLMLFALVHQLAAHEFKAGDLEIDHPWSRATPDGAKVAAGYLVIRNNGAEPDRLLSASGVIAGRTEIHEMAVDADGVMTMRPLPAGIEIPAGGTVALKPGSFHVMFMDLKRGVVEGELFKGSVTFEKAGEVPLEFMVEAMGGAPAGAHDHGG